MTVPISSVWAASAMTLHRAVGASALGNAVEWFDYGIYAYGLTYISAALFPGDTEVSPNGWCSAWAKKP